MLMDGWIVDERESGSEIVAHETGQHLNELFDQISLAYYLLRGAATPEEHYFLRDGNSQMRSKHEV